MDFLQDISHLEDQITVTREKMNDLWRRRGCTDHELLAVSIELDRLIIQYQQWMSQNQNYEEMNL